MLSPVVRKVSHATPAGSSIKTLADVKGKRFAFGDINSTSGHLIPYAELKKAGVDVAQLEKVTTAKGDYLAAKVTKKGRSAAEILGEILGEVLGMPLPAAAAPHRCGYAAAAP